MPVASPFAPSSGAVTVDLKMQDLSNQIDGATQTFTVSPAYKANSLQVYHNGLLQLPSDITETSSTVFNTSFTPNSDDNLVVIFVQN